MVCHLSDDCLHLALALHPHIELHNLRKGEREGEETRALDTRMYGPFVCLALLDFRFLFQVDIYGASPVVDAAKRVRCGNC